LSSNSSPSRSNRKAVPKINSDLSYTYVGTCRDPAHTTQHTQRHQKQGRVATAGRLLYGNTRAVCTGACSPHDSPMCCETAKPQHSHKQLCVNTTLLQLVQLLLHRY
jgi:hypothetical protein